MCLLCKLSDGKEHLALQLFLCSWYHSPSSMLEQALAMDPDMSWRMLTMAFISCLTIPFLPLLSLVTNNFHNPNIVIIWIAGTVISIAFFNFAGISVTKELTATTRMVLDSVRTLVIWVVSMTIGWQSFFYLQLIGFCILLVGMMLYNDIIILPGIKFILVKFSVLQPEDPNDRDLLVDAEDDLEREVELSREDD